MPADEEDLAVSQQMQGTEQSLESNEENINVLIKNSNTASYFEDETLQEQENVEQEEQVENEDEIDDSKIGVLEQINIKRELTDDVTENIMFDNYEEESESENYHQVVEYNEDENNVDDGDDAAAQYETEAINETNIDNEEHLHTYEAEGDENATNLKKEITTYSQLASSDTYDEIFIGDGTNNQSENEETNQMSDGEYEIVEGIHITGDIVEQNDELTDNESILHQVLTKNHGNIRYDKNDSILKETNNQNDRAVLYYVVSPPEKENVNSLQTTTLYKQIDKANPRSLLKSSYTVQQQPIIKQEPLQFHKRFARSKQAVQARQFHNFISNTSIVQAPTRLERLPRKQQIKPVNERMDEEIIVKEVMVSRNTFVEDVTKEQLPPNGYVEYIDLSDTDEEYDPKGKKKRKQIRKKREETSSSESEISIIEIDSNDEIDDDNNDDDDDGGGGVVEENRRSTRGRPKKINKIEKNEIESPTKRRRGRPPKQTQDNKKEFKCPHCPKTFPSTNSLNTHVQHHSLENRLRSQVNIRKTVQKFDYKHKCTKCEQTFKNIILLDKHKCKFDCNICMRQFVTKEKLTQHKRTHTKERLIKNTSLVQISPKKQPTTAPLKCNICLKVCSNETVLNTHMKYHRTYQCKTCLLEFSSQILLNAHLRTSCVKQRKSIPNQTNNNRRLSLNVRKSMLNTSTRLALPLLTCDDCKKKFRGHEVLYKHKVIVHGMNTPDKEQILKRKRNQKLISGIPIVGRLKSTVRNFTIVMQQSEATTSMNK